MKTINSLVFLIGLLVFAGRSFSQNAPGPVESDPFEGMLSALGIDHSTLGFEPKGYWIRYPDPVDIPYRMLPFNDLFADPEYLYDYTRAMALSVEDYFSGEYLNKKDRGGSKAILKTVYTCGIRNLTSQFRDYSASLWAETDENEPLVSAIRSIYEQTGRVYRYNALNQASDFPLIEKDLRKAILPLPFQVRRVVAKSVLHLLDAWKFRQIGMRNVDMEDAVRCWRIRHLGETQFDGLEYFPELDDCAQAIDMNSIFYAGNKIMETGELLADTLGWYIDAKKISTKDLNLDVETPIGRIVLGDSGKQKYTYSDLLLLIDFGGNDTYTGAVGSTPSLEIPVSLAVDLSGNDHYTNEDEYLPSQGAAIFGAAMLLDVRGDDRYESRRLAQGAAMFGIGVQVDMEGDDEYSMWTSGQGAAYFGVGVSIDNHGDDRYYLWGDGQGYGGVGGSGTLINHTGNDRYLCELYSKNAFRPDYHSKNGKLNYSYAQGCGVGRRGDITDGHSWAGGAGTLIDIEGDDFYSSANWSLGCGYWYGMGFVYDGGGNDQYESGNWSQASGAHFAIGVMIDEAGNDEHLLTGHQSAGFAFGHDYTVALLMDRAGDDSYELQNDGLGYAINMSQVFFFDLSGNDSYITSEKSHCYGMNNYDKYNPPILGAMFHLFSSQVCLFGDFAGTDSYRIKDIETGKLVDSPSNMADGRDLFWPDEATRDSLAEKEYYGMARDLAEPSGNVEIFRNKYKRRYHKEKTVQIRLSQ